MAKNKCALEGCGKKLDLTAFPCKCKQTFCSAHRYESEHNCSYDYREKGKEELLKTMSSPVIAPKIAII
jgi:hypothetical protein